MKRILGFVLLSCSLAVLPLAAGCSRAPQKATETEAMEGMDNMDSFNNTADPGEEEGPGAPPT